MQTWRQIHFFVKRLSECKLRPARTIDGKFDLSFKTFTSENRKPPSFSRLEKYVKTTELENAHHMIIRRTAVQKGEINGKPHRIVFFVVVADFKQSSIMTETGELGS